MRRLLPALFWLALPAVPSFGASSSAPKLLPAPWADGEALWFVGRRAGEDRPRLAGFTRADVEVVSRGEDGRWILRSYAIRPGYTSSTLGVMAGTAEIRTIEVDAETLAPVSFRLQAGESLSPTLARFADGRAEVASRDRSTRTYDLAEAAFDESELPFVLRRLSLSPGRTITFSVFAGGPGVYPVRVEPLALEKVTVPAGTFDCIKVEVHDQESPRWRARIEFPSGGVSPSGPRQYWISTDHHRYLVKQVDGSLIRQLVNVSRWDAATPLSFSNERWNVSLKVPAGWIAMPWRSEPDWTLNTLVMSSEAEVFCGVRFDNFLLMRKDPPRERPAGWRPEKVRAYAERDVKGAARHDTGYAVREDSWRESTVDGVSTVRFIADFANRVSKAELVDYRSYANDPMRAVVTCVSRKGSFEPRRPEIEALMDGLRLR